MAGAAPGQCIAQSDHEMAGASHVSGDQDRLARLAEERGKLLGPRPSRPGGPFAMDAKALWDAVHPVRLEFGDIVADIVDKADFFGSDS